MTVGTLIRNERIKTLHRPAFWVAVVGFAAMLSLSFIGDYIYRASEDAPLRTLPDAWAFILGEMGIIAAFFAAVVVILLVANEFSWRTARQNVIDGLSKELWFAGKLLLIPALAVGFVAVDLAIGGGVALYATAGADGIDTIVRGADLAHFAGVTLAAAGYGGLAFLCAMAVRSAGAALGVFFLYLVVVDQLIAAVLGYSGLESLARYTPVNTFTGLTERGLWESGAAAGAQVPDPGVVVSVAAGWILVFTATAFLDFMRRDL